MRALVSCVMNAVLSGLSAAGCLMVTSFCSTMCMYTLPGEDVFTGTVWECDEVPLGPIDVQTLSLHFGKGGDWEIQMTLDEQIGDSSSAGVSRDTSDFGCHGMVLTVSGHYLHNNAIAVFQNDAVVVDGRVVSFVEADWGDDQVLFLLWRVGDIMHPFTTALTRVE